MGIYHDRDAEFAETFGRAFDDVEVTVRRWIERTGIDGSGAAGELTVRHAASASRLGRRQKRKGDIAVDFFAVASIPRYVGKNRLGGVFVNYERICG